LISSLTVNVPSGGGGTARGDVNFYDYDGTIVNSYSAAEFAQLSAMPENPSHDGLTAHGWNWTLSDAKTYVASYGRLDIGQMYVTSDGKTRLYITLTEGRTSPILKLTLASGSEVDVDWGDGTNHDTLSGSGDKTTNRHEYASAGSYVISITVSSGGITIPQYVLSDGNSSTSSPDKAYLNAIKKVEIGSGVTSIGNNAFQSCSSLSSITIPSSVTSIGTGMFQYCYSLSSIIIPSSVTSIGSDAFYNCYSLSSIIIPSSVNSIGSSAFYNCYSLSSIIIPSSVNSIGSSAFYSCSSLSSITIPSSVTSIGDTSFQNCSSLSSIIIPSSVSSISGNMFQYCNSLSSIIIPSSVKSIGSNVFYSCSSLSSIIIPSSVTTIGSYAFQRCYSLATITILGKSSGDISGAPWSASTGSPTNTQIIWENDQYTHIYGVSWDKSSSSILTRTDDAANFSNPDPYVNDGVHSGSSPFDALMPWAGMVQETINGNVLVKIPKFWYKWTSTSSTLKLQIADKAVAGFHVSPAHADRGDGKGERDYVYIARYKCSSTDYKSVTGKSPKVSITRDAARTAIKALGTGLYQQDFAMFWTTRMLYLVEYANWNSQAAIGYGCGNGSSVQNTGTSDGMPYHTGTKQSSRATYGVGVQYRWIEDPWGNVREWCDGIYFAGTNKADIYIIKNPSSFSDTTGGTKVGTRLTTSGSISDWSIPTATGFEYALYPSAVSGGAQTYIADYCHYSSSGVALYVGSYYDQNQSYGMFYLGGDNTASESGSRLGARLMYLP
jgi:hypothetical protein